MALIKIIHENLPVSVKESKTAGLLMKYSFESRFSSFANCQNFFQLKANRTSSNLVSKLESYSRYDRSGTSFVEVLPQT